MFAANSDSFVPEGKAWIVVDGYTHSELFEVDSGTFEEERTRAIADFRKMHSGDAIMKVGRIQDRRDA